MIQVVVTGSDNATRVVETIDKHVDRILIVKIGTEHRPATDADIENACEQLRKALKADNNAGDIGAIVTHHAVDVQEVYLRC